jgi:type II secretory pathway pseudopilin PulG
MHRARPGYILVYILLTVAIMAALATALVPAMTGKVDSARIATTAATMQTLVLAVDTFTTHVTKLPGKVSQLTTAIKTTDRNSCHAVFVAGEVTNWVTYGPYLANAFADVNGLYTPIGRVRDSIPIRVAGKNDLYIDIPGVDVNDAAKFKFYIDAGAGDTVSTIPTVVTRTDTTTVRFRVVKGSLLPNGQC